MNANSWINNYNDRARARSRNSTSGFTVGGPVYIPGVFNKKKDKLFFFVNFEWQRPAVYDALAEPDDADRSRAQRRLLRDAGKRQERSISRIHFFPDLQRHRSDGVLPEQQNPVESLGIPTAWSS